MSAVSPTAHYTGFVWARNGLSHPVLATREGRLLYDAVWPVNGLSKLLGGPTLESYLLARHRALDTLLERAIEQDGVSQVIEVACGLSPRGWRFARRYGARLTYVEADLPDMAARKRRALDEIGSLSPHHRVVDLDATAVTGPESLSAVAATLDPAGGLAIVTEGLLSYLDRDDVDALWRRFAGELSEFGGGRYLSDIGLGGGAASPLVSVFLVGLSAFVRGRVSVHFREPDDVAAALRRAGFDDAEVRPAAEVALVDDTADLGVRAATVFQASVGQASVSRTGSESSP